MKRLIKMIESIVYTNPTECHLLVTNMCGRYRKPVCVFLPWVCAAHLPCSVPSTQCYRQHCKINETMEFVWSEVEDNDAIKAECKGYKAGLVRSDPGGWTMQPTTAAMCPTFASMDVRQNDVWVVSYPKTGTTWTQELVWQVANNLDLAGGKVDLNERFPFLELDTLTDFTWLFPGIRGKIASLIFNCVVWWKGVRFCHPHSWLGYNSFAEQLRAVPGSERRFIKTHLPLSLLPPNLVSTAKVIYVARNPKDVMVSYYHHHKLVKGHGYVGDLPQFANRFMNDEIMMGPFFKHVEEGWTLKDNLLFIFYEDMKRDLKTVIKRVSHFLECSLTDAQEDQLIQHLDIETFRNNPAVNNEFSKTVGLFEDEGNFIRKGEVGGWKEDFAKFADVEINFDNWVVEKMTKSKVDFPVLQ